jgi:predicted dehydrogenase
MLGAGDAVRPYRTLSGDWLRFYTGMVAALRSGGPVPVDPAEAVAALEVLEAARRSAATGTVVQLDTH